MPGSVIAAAQSSPQSSALDLILRGRGLIAAGQPRDALQCAEEALKLEPRDPDALYLLGEAHYGCGELHQAEVRLRQSIQANSRVALYHSTLGNVLQDRGALDEAIRSYRRAIALKPDFAEPHNDLGTAYFAQGNAARAAQAYLKAAQLRPDHAVAHANLGAVYRKLGLPREARRALQREFLLRLYGVLRSLTRVRRISLVELAKRELEQGNPRLAARIAQKTIAEESKSVDALTVLGAAQERLGATEEALATLKAASALKPRDGALRAQLGRLLAAKGEHEAAIEHFEESLRLQPRAAQNLVALAELRLAKGELEQAEERARQALKLEPRAAAAHFVLAETLIRQGRTEDSESLLRTAIALDPELIVARIRLGDLLRLGGQLDDAEACVREALGVNPESAPALVALGMVLRDRGKAAQAIECLEQALRIEPGRVQALHQIGEILRYEDRTAEAEQRFRQALKGRPHDAPILVALALVLGDQMRYAEAFACLEQVLAREPGCTIALNAKGLLLDLIGKRVEAEEAYSAALRSSPNDVDTGFSLAICRLRHRNLADGWKGFELRRANESFVGRYRKFPFPEWQGESLAGKAILVYPEQGLGDEILYGSCIPDLAASARHVAIECDPKLGALFTRSFPNCTVTPRVRTKGNDWVNHLDPRPEYQVPIGSLPLHFRARAEDFPAHRGFLAADPAKVAAWKSRLEALGPGPKIGLSWRGGVGHTGRARRSFRLDQLRPVLEMQGLHFVNLQYTDVRDELAEVRNRFGITVHHWQEAIDDYDETAALVCALDRVLSVCTAIVHLTGALGRPAIVMVPFGSDWRYGAEGERMLWYPSVRLVRQRAIGQWAGVLETVRGLLARGE